MDWEMPAEQKLRKVGPGGQAVKQDAAEQLRAAAGHTSRLTVFEMPSAALAEALTLLAQALEAMEGEWPRHAAEIAHEADGVSDCKFCLAIQDTREYAERLGGGGA